MRVALIGAGNMSNAIVAGIVRNGLCSGSDITVYDISQDMMSKMSKMYSVKTAESIIALSCTAEIIILAVKPQNYPSVLDELSGCDMKGKVIVTIAAGKSIAGIKEYLGENTHIVRVMPNTPLLISEGATAAARDDLVTDEEFEKVCSIFRCSGKLEVVSEDKINPITAVNGSSPAYFFLFAKAMCEYAQSVGIDYETAKRLIAQTMRGSAEMIIGSGDDLQLLIDKVTSPKGTTASALQVFYERDVSEIIKEAMAACTKRAEELK